MNSVPRNFLQFVKNIETGLNTSPKITFISLEELKSCASYFFDRAVLHPDLAKKFAEAVKRRFFVAPPVNNGEETVNLKKAILRECEIRQNRMHSSLDSASNFDKQEAIGTTKFFAELFNVGFVHKGILKQQMDILEERKETCEITNSCFQLLIEAVKEKVEKMSETDNSIVLRSLMISIQRAATNSEDIIIPETTNGIMSLGLSTRDNNEALDQDDQFTVTSNKNWPPTMTIDFNKVLGTGGRGTKVYEGTANTRKVAIKRLPEYLFQTAKKEIELLQKIDFHENVVTFVFPEMKNGYIDIAIELCLASLDDFVRNKNNLQAFRTASDERNIPIEVYASFTLVDTKEILEQAMLGLQFLHNSRIVHRDVKPQNILVSLPQRGRKNRFLIKMSDFGLSKEINDGRESFSTVSGPAGTEGWVAPEILEPGNQRKTKAVDIFSMGCVFYYVICDGRHVFGERFRRNGHIIDDKIDMTALEARLDNQSILAKSLIKDMIRKDSSKRPSAADILNHPYFWGEKNTLDFLQDVSDLVIGSYPNADTESCFQKSEELLFGDNWIDCLDDIPRDFVKTQKYRGNSMKDLIRLLRNMKHHFNKLPKDVKYFFEDDTGALIAYWTNKFPHLLSATYYAMDTCKEEKNFKQYYSSYGFTRPDYLLPNPPLP